MQKLVSYGRIDTRANYDGYNSQARSSNQYQSVSLPVYKKLVPIRGTVEQRYAAANAPKKLAGISFQPTYIERFNHAAPEFTLNSKQKIANGAMVKKLIRENYKKQTNKIRDQFASRWSTKAKIESRHAPSCLSQLHIKKRANARDCDSFVKLGLINREHETNDQALNSIRALSVTSNGNSNEIRIKALCEDKLKLSVGKPRSEDIVMRTRTYINLIKSREKKNGESFAQVDHNRKFKVLEKYFSTLNSKL